MRKPKHDSDFKFHEEFDSALTLFVLGIENDHFQNNHFKNDGIRCRIYLANTERKTRKSP